MCNRVHSFSLHLGLFVCPRNSRTPLPVPIMLHTPETQARMYGGAIACYMWSIYLCDFYRLDLWMSIVCIVLGACFLCYLYPSSPHQSWTHKNDDLSTHCPQQGRTICQGQQHQQQQQPSAFFNPQPMSSISAAVVTPSVSESSSTPLPVLTLSVLAQECNASEVHSLYQDDVVLHLSVHSEERNSVNRNWIQSYSVDSKHENTAERNEIPRRSQYAWLVFATHSLIVLGYLSVAGADLITDWIGTTLAVRGLMILGVLTCNGLLARWAMGPLGPLNSQVQQEHVEDGGLEMMKATMGCLMDAEPLPKMAAKQVGYLWLVGYKKSAMLCTMALVNLLFFFRGSTNFCRSTDPVNSSFINNR